MLGSTHRFLGDQISGYLGLNETEKSILRESITFPDFEGNFPHHDNKYIEINWSLKNSRYYYLLNNQKYLFYLGVALHYIQDGWTTNPRLRDLHTAWERRIDEIQNNLGITQEWDGSSFFVSLPHENEPAFLDYYSYMDIATRQKAERANGYRAWEVCNQTYKKSLDLVPIPSESKEFYNRHSDSQFADIFINLALIRNELNEFDQVRNNPSIIKNKLSPPNLDDAFLIKTMQEAFYFIQKPRISHRYIDLFHSFYSSLFVACSVCFPQKYSPNSWNDTSRFHTCELCENYWKDKHLCHKNNEIQVQVEPNHCSEWFAHVSV